MQYTDKCVSSNSNGILYVFYVYIEIVWVVAAVPFTCFVILIENIQHFCWDSHHIIEHNTAQPDNYMYYVFWIQDRKWMWCKLASGKIPHIPYHYEYMTHSCILSNAHEQF